MKDLRVFLPLFLVAGSRVLVNFKSFDKVVDKLGGLPIPKD